MRNIRASVNNVRGAPRPLIMLIGAAFRADRRGAVLTLLFDTLRGLTAPLYGLWLKLLVDAATQHDERLAVAGAVGMTASAGVPWLAGGMGSRIRLALEERVGFFLERQLAARSSSLPGIDHFENPDYLDRMHLVREEQGTLGSAVGSLVIIIGMLVQAITVLVLLGTVHPILLLLPALGLPILATEGAWQRRLGRAEEETAEAARRARHLEDLVTSAESAKELRIFGLDEEILRRHRDALLAVYRARISAQWAGSAGAIGAWLLFALAFAGSIAFVAWRATHGLATAGDIVLVISLAGSARISMAGLLRAVARTLRLLRSANRFLWLEDYARTNERQSEIPNVPVPTRLHSGIALRNVSFRYPNAEEWVLRDVSLDLPAGSVVALVGENGAGKTSLVKLLCRFYRPTGGTVTVDGIDLNTFDPRQWRQRISGAFQDYARFQLRIGEAVGVGDLPRMRDSGAVLNALEAAGAADLPGRLSRGLETQLGRTWEQGVDLSLGQWQKVALGRGLMRQAPLLLIFDEPTAALDAPTEHLLFERMTRAARQRRELGTITLLISHRFSTVRMADRIVVLSDGRIGEVGTHEELLAHDGLYAELYRLQAASYA